MKKLTPASTAPDHQKLFPSSRFPCSPPLLPPAVVVEDVAVPEEEGFTDKNDRVTCGH